MSFSSIWKRILEETDIKNLSELAGIVGTTQPYVSRKKKNDEFPVEWAFKVAEKYNLLVEWLFYGRGPRRLSDASSTFNQSFLKEIDEWLSEFIAAEPNRKEWFECSFEDCFPLFKEWRKFRTQKLL
ncbi:MAG: bacteriophage CI repressor [Desulfobulbaceae bacterium]|nr:MAG: bacteriophage CI repressor [Desulfobulbaceae bacterium]